jgi:hypothetical protein
MKAVVARVLADTNRPANAPGAQKPPLITLEEVDISTDAALEERYGLEIPVLLLNGKKAAKYRVTEGDLRRILKAGAAE